jgi:hypothetical protein
MDKKHTVNMGIRQYQREHGLGTMLKNGLASGCVEEEEAMTTRDMGGRNLKKNIQQRGFAGRHRPNY